MSKPKTSFLAQPDDQFKVYLPKKGENWADTNTLMDKNILTHYDKPYGKMEILNDSTFKDCLDNGDDQFGKYDPMDAEIRHPSTLYLTPGRPVHRSDSLSR